MTCGSCNMTDGCCYTSLPPKVKCNVTGEFHYYDDECNCEDIKAEKAAEFKKITDLLRKPGALSIATDKFASEGDIIISGATAAASFDSLVNLPLYEQTCEYATHCLVCSTEVPTLLGEGPKVCPECKKVIKFIKEKFNKELESYEV